MDVALYSAFLLVSFGIIIVPGPNVLVIVSTSIAHGRKRGLQTVAGTSLAMAIQLLMVALGTAGLVRLVSDGLYYLKWMGVVYLIYLGLSHLYKAIHAQQQVMEDSASATFVRGFLVSLANPKTLLFFGAFLPQFVSASGNYNQQIALLSFSFLLMAIVLDSCYALLSSGLTVLARQRYLNSARNSFSGLLYLGASAWLAAARRSS